MNTDTIAIAAELLDAARSVADDAARVDFQRRAFLLLHPTLVVGQRETETAFSVWRVLQERGVPA